jgi:hypothetical protein
MRMNTEYSPRTWGEGYSGYIGVVVSFVSWGAMRLSLLGTSATN